METMEFLFYVVGKAAPSTMAWVPCEGQEEEAVRYTKHCLAFCWNAKKTVHSLHKERLLYYRKMEIVIDM